MEFREVASRAEVVSALYDELNAKQGFPVWKLQEYVQGLMEDTGSLVRLTMMKSQLRENRFEDLDEKLRHEVCDCLWSVLRIARELNIDLETEFPRQMDKLAQRIKEQGF